MTDTLSSTPQDPADAPATRDAWLRERSAALASAREALEARLLGHQVAWKNAHDAAEELREQTRQRQDALREQIAELSATIAQLDADTARESAPHTKAMGDAVAAMVDREKQPVEEVAIRLGVTPAQVRAARTAAKSKPRKRERKSRTTDRNRPTVTAQPAPTSSTGDARADAGDPSSSDQAVA